MRDENVVFKEEEGSKRKNVQDIPAVHTGFTKRKQRGLGKCKINVSRIFRELSNNIIISRPQRTGSYMNTHFPPKLPLFWLVL